MPLSGDVDLIDDGVQHAIGQFLRTVGQPGKGDPFEVAIRWSCETLRRWDRPGIGIDGRPEGLCGVVQT